MHRPTLPYRRAIASTLLARLAEPPQRLQILAGPRQVGKTTLVHQILGDRPIASYSAVADGLSDSAMVFATPRASVAISANPPSGVDWLHQVWAHAEHAALAWQDCGHPIAQQLPYVLVVDEIQHVPQWSSVVKALWDRARAQGAPMNVVLLGSAPLLVQQGLSESLTGRYELIRMNHWSFDEMNDAFGLTLDEFIHFGGYPGSAGYIDDEPRWRAYVRDALIEPSIAKDVLAMARVDAPALLRRLFELGCDYSGQIVALDKVSSNLGKGHTLTLAHHLTLLSQAGLLGGLQKYAGQTLRQRASPPKFQVHNNALMTAGAGYDFAEARADRSHWGRLVESAVGAHLLTSADSDTRIHYWREASQEVDFIVERLGRLAAIEVKTAPGVTRHRGLDAFCQRHPQAKRWLVGSDELPLGEFLRQPAAHWTR